MPFLDMDDATACRLVNVLCPAALIVTVYDLTQALNHLEHWAIGSALLMIAVVVVAWLVVLTHEEERKYRDLQPFSCISEAVSASRQGIDSIKGPHGEKEIL